MWKGRTDCHELEEDSLGLEEDLLSYGVLTLFGEISSKSSGDFIKKLILLQLRAQELEPAEREKVTIRAFICSPGGDEDAMLAMTDFIEAYSLPLLGFGIGQVASAAVWVLASFPKGSRIAFPSTQFLIHEGFISISGKISDAQGVTRESIRRNRLCIEKLAQWTGKNTKTIKRLVSKETFLNAEQAKRFGLIDDIISPA